MEDFYKKVKKNIEERPEPAYNKADWNSLSKKLEQRRQFFPMVHWAWVLLPLLLLMGSNIYWFRTDKILEEKYMYSEKKDTVYIVKEIHRVDTIYIATQMVEGEKARKLDDVYQSSIQRQTKLEKQVELLQRQMAREQERYSLIESKNAVNKTTISENPINENVTDYQKQELIQNSLLIKNENSDMDSEQNTLNIGIADVKKSSQENNLNTTKLDKVIPTKNAEDSIAAGSPILEEEAKKPSVFSKLYKEIKNINPGELQLGIGAGLLYPSYGKGEFSIGASYGINALVPLSEHFQTEVNLYYQDAIYDTKVSREVVDNEVLPPTADFTLQKIEAPFNVMHLDVGINYAFNTLYRLQPKIGVGYALQYYWQKEVFYEFTNNAAFINLINEESINKSGFSAENVLFQAGADYWLSTSLALNVRALYRNVLGTETYYNSNYWRIGAGLRYKF